MEVEAAHNNTPYTDNTIGEAVSREQHPFKTKFLWYFLLNKDTAPRSKRVPRIFVGALACRVQGSARSDRMSADVANRDESSTTADLRQRTGHDG